MPNQSQNPVFVALPDILGGRAFAVQPWAVKIARSIARLLWKVPRHHGGVWRFRKPPEEGDFRSPDSGKPAPLNPSPTHHLVAHKALPPSDHTYLLESD